MSASRFAERVQRRVMWTDVSVGFCGPMSASGLVLWTESSLGVCGETRRKRRRRAWGDVGKRGEDSGSTEDRGNMCDLAVLDGVAWRRSCSVQCRMGQARENGRWGWTMLSYHVSAIIASRGKPSSRQALGHHRFSHHCFRLRAIIVSGYEASSLQAGAVQLGSLVDGVHVDYHHRTLPDLTLTSAHPFTSAPHLAHTRPYPTSEPNVRHTPCASSGHGPYTRRQFQT
eukprot:1205131-Rhodomonas_salina.1